MWEDLVKLVELTWTDPYLTFSLYAPSRQIHGYMYNTFTSIMPITPITQFWLWHRDFLWDGG